MIAGAAGVVVKTNHGENLGGEQKASGVEQGAGVSPTPVSCVRDYAETPIVTAPHPRRTRSGTGMGMGRDLRFSQAFRECAVSSGSARSGSPRLIE